jgi:hypothetical protein
MPDQMPSCSRSRASPRSSTTNRAWRTFGPLTEGLEAPAYAEQGLGDLWHESEPAETSGVDRGIYANRNLGNLWNSAL